MTVVGERDPDRINFDWLIRLRWAAIVGPQRIQALRSGLGQAVLAESGGALPPVRPAW